MNPSFSSTAAFRSLIPFLCLFVAIPARSTAARGLSRPRSVWYDFDSAAAPGRSIGVTPWPAFPFHTRMGEGIHGKALVLPGVTANGLLLPNPAAFFGDTARAGTLALWIKPDSDPMNGNRPRVILDFMVQARNTLIDGYEIAMLLEGDRLAAQAALGRRMYAATPLPRDRWTHVALTWNADTGSALFVNGQQVAERKGRFKPTPLSRWPGRLGSHTPSGGYPFRGAVDDLRLFNRMLTPAELKSVAQLEPATPALKVRNANGVSMRVKNVGTTRTLVRLREWLPEENDGTERWGHLPLPGCEIPPQPVYLGGASGVIHSDTQPVSLAPGETVALPLSGHPDYRRWRRVSLLAGRGLTCREVWARDYRGLVCQAVPSVLFSKPRAVIHVRFRNDTARPYAGSLKGRLFRLAGGTAVPLTLTDLRLRPGEETTRALPLTTAPLPVGSYRLVWTTAPANGVPASLRPVTLHVTENVTYKTLFGLGAAYVMHPPSPELLHRMANDSVNVLRRSRGEWWNEDRTIYPYGFKTWYTSAYSSRRICTRPEVVAETERLAARLGAWLKRRPTALNQVMLGEGLNRPPCYCDHCNQAFRNHLKDKYGTIKALNVRWQARYKSFAEINQLGSPKDVDLAAERMKLMQRELPTQFRRRWRELFRLDPTRAIEWKRWHESVLLDWYTRFAQAFHKTNRHATALSEQPCWPDFNSHVLFHLGKVADLGGMDLYLPGELPTTLGYASELFCNFDFNASVFHGKPLWLHELYVQDNSPPGLAEAQGWFLVGRGYSMLTYFTYDYYREGVRANLPLIFGLFDKQWKPYPCYESFARFSREVRKFHADYDAHSLRRVEAQVALFLGDDVSLANFLETGGATWGAAGVHGHIGAYWLTERNGYPVDFVNDEGLNRLEGKRVLLVPWTHVIRRDSLAKMLSFARGGGTVIFDGPVGLYDELYRPYQPLPGGGLMDELGIRYSGYDDEPNELIVPQQRAGLQARTRTRIATRGVPQGVTVHGAEILARDAEGRPGLVHTRVGNGQVFMFLTNIGRTHRSRKPDPNAVALWGGLLAQAGLKSPVSWRERSVVGNRQTGPAKLDHGGAGVPSGEACFDVSVRRRGNDEVFLFMVSFFNATDAAVTVRLPKANYRAGDAVTHKPIPLTKTDDGYSLPVHLPPFGTQVVRIWRQQPSTAARRSLPGQKRHRVKSR